MVYNKAMRNLLDKAYKKKEKQIKITNTNLQELLFPNIVYMNDCVFISQYSKEINKVKLKKFLKNNPDKIAFEVDMNETLINQYIDDTGLFASDITPFALTIIKAWIRGVKSKESKNIFCFICSCSNKLVTIRFHKIRAAQQLWLGCNIDEYNQPVAYEII